MNFHIRALSTCRYWAFGSWCPDGHQCQFAHYDTGGQLASHLEQRGTCVHWAAGQCRTDNTCFYEHRYTGVPGMYQGVVPLTGLELQIADAARKSGFNTFNHVALFDLIWSVKRVALRSADGKHRPQHPPPKHPIYPDRYRPSGVGDNTKRKRPSDIIVRKSYSLPHAQPQKRKRKRKGRKNTPAEHISPGTQIQPIIIDSDDEKSSELATKSSENLAKRQKTTRSDDVVHVVPLKLELVQQPDVSSANVLLSEFAKVKAILAQTQKDMAACQVTMKTMYDDNEQKMSDKFLRPLLKALSHNMFLCHDAAKAGVDNMVKIINHASPIKDEIL